MNFGAGQIVANNSSDTFVLCGPDILYNLSGLLGGCMRRLAITWEKYLAHGNNNSINNNKNNNNKTFVEHFS